MSRAFGDDSGTLPDELVHTGQDLEVDDRMTVRALRRMAATTKRFLRELGRGDRAAAMIEYALIAVAIAVAAVAGVQALSGAIGGTFENHQDSVTEEMQGGPSSP